MSHEIIPGGRQAVSVAASHAIGEILQPLIREIHLFDTWIAGTTHLEDRSALEALKENDELLLQRESNEFDSMAILVLDRDRHRLGYIPEKDNLVFARLMDAGKTLKAKISRIEDMDVWTKVSIGICLVDL